MPAGIDLANAPVVGALVGEVLRKLGVSGGIVMAVPRAQVVLKPLTLPAGTPENELPGMVQFQADKDLPFRAEEAVIDFIPGSHFGGDRDAPSGDGVEVLVAAARIAELDYYRQIAAAAGARLLHLGMSSTANMACMLACTRRGADESVACLHLTPEEMQIDIIRGGGLSFARAASVKLPAAAADSAGLAAGVKAALQEALRSVHSYQSSQRGGISGVLVAGGTGVEAQLAEQLTERLGVPCELFRPELALPLPDAQQAAPFITALGLAIGYGGGQRSIDFINPRRPVQQSDPRRRRLMMAGAAAAAVVLVVGGVTWAMFSSRESDLDRLAAEANRLKEQNKSIATLEKRAKALEGFDASRRMWLDHLAQFSSLMPPCEQAYVTAMNVGGSNVLNVTMHAKSTASIDKFINEARAAGYRLESRRSGVVADRNGYTQEIVLEVGVPATLKVDPTTLSAHPRPADDDSLAVLSGTVARPSGPYSPAAAAAPAAAAPPAGPTGAGGAPTIASLLATAPQEYQRINWDFMSKDAPGVQNYRGVPVALAARISRSTRFVPMQNLPLVTENDFTCSVATEVGGKRAVFIYCAKSNPANELIQRKTASSGTGRGLVFWGKATYGAGGQPEVPVVVVVDGAADVPPEAMPQPTYTPPTGSTPPSGGSSGGGRGWKRN
jgi:predicted ribosomally synthesized peptide with SipW-like signal peptide